MFGFKFPNEILLLYELSSTCTFMFKHFLLKRFQLNFISLSSTIKTDGFHGDLEQEDIQYIVKRLRQ